MDLSILTNPFFRYHAVVTESAFERMKEKQNITVDFDDGFLMTLKEQLIACRERESANVMCFTMNSTGSGTLVFIEDLGHKLVETLRIDFEQYDERDIQERVALEYREMARDACTARRIWRRRTPRGGSRDSIRKQRRRVES